MTEREKMLAGMIYDPISPALRERALQYNRPVRIGENVWIGAGFGTWPLRRTGVVREAFTMA